MVGHLECPGRVASQECMKEDWVEVDIDMESVRGPPTHKLDYGLSHALTTTTGRAENSFFSLSLDLLSYFHT